MKVVVSAGLGRLHLFDTARALAKEGVCVRLIGGWIPKKNNSVFVKLLSWLAGHDLSSGFRKRQIAGGNLEVVSLGWVDFLDHFLIVFARRMLMRMGIDPLWGWLLFGWRTRKYISGYDVLHVRSGAGQGGAIAFAKKIGIKVVVDHSIAHSAFMDRSVRCEYEKHNAQFDAGMDSKFWQMVLKDCAEADLLLVNSDFVKQTFVDEGYPAERIEVLYLGVADAFLGLRKYPSVKMGGWRLLFTGGFGFRKGCEYLIEAVRILKNRGVRGFKLDVVGSIGIDKLIVDTIKKEALPIVLHGHMSQEKMSRFLEEADIYVFPSLAEGCAKSGMEAMAAGVCVVATEESGLPIRDGDTGFIVPSHNAIVLADKIEWLMAHYEVVSSVGGAAAGLMASEYRESMYAKKLENVYETLLR